MLVSTSGPRSGSWTIPKVFLRWTQPLWGQRAAKSLSRHKMESGEDGVALSPKHSEEGWQHVKLGALEAYDQWCAFSCKAIPSKPTPNSAPLLGTKCSITWTCPMEDISHVNYHTASSNKLSSSFISDINFYIYCHISLLTGSIFMCAGIWGFRVIVFIVILII